MAPKGTSPVENGEFLFVRLSIRLFIRVYILPILLSPPPPPGLILAQGGLIQDLKILI